MRIHSDYRKYAKAARKAGWTITMTGSKHLKWTSPAGRSVFSPSTPSDCRGRHRVAKKLRDAGLEIA